MSYRTWDPAARRMVARGYPHFRVLQVGDRYARVTDSSLTGVRLAERPRREGQAADAQAGRAGPDDRRLARRAAGQGGNHQRRFAQVRFPGWHMPLATAVHLLEEVKA
jgi:hypothetical protein